MKIINRGYLFSIFWIGLIITTYLGMGEKYILLFFCATVFVSIKSWQYLKVSKQGFFKYFILYYVVISTFALITDYVGIRNYIELMLKYIVLSLVVYTLIPNNYSERINMFRVLKTIIFISAFYGFIESLIKYNYMVEFVELESKIWMRYMEGASNYQPSSFFLHYNYYGFVLILGLILVRYIPYKNKFINYLYWILLIEQIIICQSRISWIAAVVVIIIGVFKSEKISNRGIKNLIIIFLMLICLIIFEPTIINEFGRFISNRFSRLWIYGFKDGSLGQRVGTLLNWFPYFEKNLLRGIFGTGYQSISVEFMKDYSYFAGYSTADCQITVYLVETGIVGVIVLFFATIEFLKKKKCSTIEQSNIFSIGKMCFIAIMVECLTLDLVSNNIILSLMMLMICAVNKKQMN